MPGLTLSTRRTPGGYRYAYTGIIKRGRQVVFECGHLHYNRDNDSDRHESASTCARRALHIFAASAGALGALSRWGESFTEAAQTSG